MGSGPHVDAIAPPSSLSAWANDPTPQPAVRFARRFGLEIAYDSHEWFTEAEGSKPLRRIWRQWERVCFRSIDRMLTVNDAIAEAYREQLEVEVVPVSLSERRKWNPWIERSLLADGPKGPVDQGAFMDRDRGHGCSAGHGHLRGCHLALIGAGPEHAEAAAMADRLGISEQVHVHDRMPFDELRQCTAAADVGLSLDRPTV